MSFADKRASTGGSVYWPHTWPRQYGFALMTVAGATLLRYPLGGLIGHNLPFVLFVPVILLVAWMAGLGPGVFAVFLSVVSAEYLFVGPAGSPPLGLPRTANGLILFSTLGIAITGVADIYRRRAKRLEESEDRYRDLVEHCQDLVCTHDLEGKLLSVNPAAARMLGYEVAELLKMQLRELIAPEFREQFEAYLGRIKTTGADHGLLRVVTQNGEHRIWEYSNTLRTEGVVSPIVRGMAHDITDRNRAEKALKESLATSEVALKELADYEFALNQHSIVAITDLEGTITYANDKFSALSQYSKSELIGQNHRILSSGHHPREFFQEMYQIIASGRVWHGEIKNRAKDGSFYWVDMTIVPTLSTAGKPLRYVAMRSDITEHKLAEEALRKSEERFRKAFRSSPLPITISTEADGRYLDVNVAFLLMLGRERRDVIGHTALELTFWSEPLDRMGMLQQLKENRQVARQQTRYRTAKGETREAEVWAELIELDGQPLAITRDVTEIQQLEAQFRHGRCPELR